LLASLLLGGGSVAAALNHLGALKAARNAWLSLVEVHGALATLAHVYIDKLKRVAGR